MTGQDRTNPPPMPWPVMVAVLIGFPAFFYLWSLPLLHREAFTFGGVDFFVTYWFATGLAYAAKIAIILWILRRVGWTRADIGLALPGSITVGKAVLGYAVLAILAFGAIELIVANSVFDPEKLARLPGLYPETSGKRAMLLFMAFFAGLSEEITYRGFAISGLVSRGINRWLAIVIAAVPFVFQHGLKSLDQFWWFFVNGLIFGTIYVLFRRLWPGIILHWLIIWTALFGIMSAVVN